MMCAWVLGAALAATAAASEVYEMGASPAPRFKVATCRLEPKAESRNAEFAAVVRYDVRTDETGVVSSVVEDGSSGSPPPLRPIFGSVERCLKSWKLEANTSYTAELHWGNSLPKPSWQVCRESGDCVQLVEAPER